MGTGSSRLDGAVMSPGKDSRSPESLKIGPKIRPVTFP